MSTTAQRKDISDPEVIHDFAQIVGSLERLDYLFALTVADISATNPELWNAWRASLLRQLYRATQNALRRGLDADVPSLNELINDTQHSVIQRLEMDEQTVSDYFAPLGASYFAQHNVDEIEWHTKSLIGQPIQPKVLMRHLMAGTQVFITGPDRNKLFAAFCRILDRGQLTVVDARVCTSNDGRVLDSFMVLDATDMTAISDTQRLSKLEQDLIEAFADPTQSEVPESGMTPRVKRYFSNPSNVTFFPDEARNRTIMELVSPDRPGLLARVASVLDEFDLELVLAKIATLGERVEDTFYIVDAQRNAIRDPEQLNSLKNRLEHILDENA